MRYAYYPGCSLHSTGKDYDMSAQAVCQALGIELVEIPDWICCGASSRHSTSKLLSVALPVKDLLSAQEMGLDTAVCCAACYSRLRIANVTMSGATERHAGQSGRTDDGMSDVDRTPVATSRICAVVVDGHVTRRVRLLAPGPTLTPPSGADHGHRRSPVTADRAGP